MPRSDNGFTLIEALVATGLAVVIALGTAQLFAIAIARSLAAREQLAMSLLASTKVNDLAALAADGTIALSPSDSLERSAGGWSDTPAGAGRVYVRRWRVAAVPGYGDEAVAIAVGVSAPGVNEVRVLTVRERRRP